MGLFLFLFWPFYYCCTIVLYGSLYKSLDYFHYSLWVDLEGPIPSQPVAVYMKVSIIYLITFIIYFWASLEDKTPGGPVAVILFSLQEG